jgi:hypothetical protein
MTEQNATPGPAAALDDDDLIDVLDGGDEDLDDDLDLDLDGEPLALDDNVIVQEFTPDDDVDLNGGVDGGVDVAVDVDGDSDVNVDVGVALDGDVEMDEEDDDDLGVEDDLVGADGLLEATMTAVPASMPEERLARLEEAARVLTQAEQTREQKRVHRKVKAATTGAGAAGFVPILLDLVGALNLSPELAATAAAGASVLGSLLAGYLTPERAQPVSTAPAAQDLLNEGV